MIGATVLTIHQSQTPRIEPIGGCDYNDLLAQTGLHMTCRGRTHSLAAGLLLEDFALEDNLDNFLKLPPLTVRNIFRACLHFFARRASQFEHCRGLWAGQVGRCF